MIQKIKSLYYRYLCSEEKYAKYLGVNIGNDCYIRTKYFGSEPYLITIGNRVQITRGVRFFTHGGVWVFRQKHPLMDVFGKITIGNNVYIGNCALIMPGVTIEDNVVIGAGAVVTKSISNGTIVAGNPAKPISNFKDLEQKMLQYNVNIKNYTFSEKKEFLLNMDEDKFIKK